MKRTYRSSTCRAAVALLAFAFVLQSDGADAEKPKSTGTSLAAQKARRDSGYVLEIANGVLEDGGRQANLGNVVNALRELYPDANIVLAPSISSIQVSDLKLRATELSEALEAIRVAAEGKILWRSGRGGGAVDPTTGLPLGAGSLFVLEPAEEPPPPGPARDIEVFNVSGYIRFLEQQQGDGAVDASMSEVLNLIRSSYKELRRNAPAQEEPPSFQFHRGANLLIVIGPRDLLDVARRVVNALPGQPPGPSYGIGYGAPSQNAPMRLEPPRQPVGTPAPPGVPSPRR